MTHRIAALILALIPLPALANDGFGGLTATGLTFAQTEDIAMLEEDLRIGPDRIAVDYVFRNTSAADITGEVIFPLPPIPLAGMAFSDFNLPDDRTRENLVDFTASVDGQPVQVAVDRVAVILPEDGWDQPAALYDTPGEDVTAKLAQFGLPLSADIGAIMAQLAAMTPAQRKVLRAEGLIDTMDGSADSPDVYPLWSVVLRYHWTQTFPAGADLRVSHSYENRPMGGIFVWEEPVPDYMQDYVDRYCIDKGTSRALVKAMQRSGGAGMALNIEYVLRTANSWAGPIGTFRLTLDKGAPSNVISLCADGVKKTGPTTFVVEKTNYMPDSDLQVLIVQPGG